MFGRPSSGVKANADFVHQCIGSTLTASLIQSVSINFSLPRACTNIVDFNIEFDAGVLSGCCIYCNNAHAGVDVIIRK